MRRLLSAAAVAILFMAVFFMPPESQAVPTFARQTGLACNTCHFQHFPSLNAFGRAFKAGGYTQVGGQSLVEGDMLSLPSTLNASLVTKVIYQKTNGDTETEPRNKGELQFPEEAALLIGGRAGEHIGFLLELAAFGAADTGTGTVTAGTADTGTGEFSLFTGYKMPIVYTVSDTNLSIIPFTTDGQGAAYGFELLNTGALKLQRPIQHRSEMSAQQYLGTGTAATGLAFVASHSLWYANYTMWSPVHGNTNAGPYLNYLRAAVTPSFGSWDFGAGVQYWKGTTKYHDSADTSADANGIVRKAADAWSIDAQLQGAVADMPLGVYLSYGVAKKTTSGETANLFNSNTVNDKSAWALAGELGVMPGRLTVSAGYRAGKKGNTADDSDNGLLLGANYLLAQNVELQLNQSWFTGTLYDTPPAAGDSTTTLMLFAAF